VSHITQITDRQTRRRTVTYDRIVLQSLCILCT